MRVLDHFGDLTMEQDPMAILVQQIPALAFLAVAGRHLIGKLIESVDRLNQTMYLIHVDMKDHLEQAK